MNNDALLATATAKSNAHVGLVNALDYGTVRVLRIDGVDHIFATGDNGTRYDCTVDHITGSVSCLGYVVNSTCRDLALDALRAARRH